MTVMLLRDDFTGSGVLAGRTPDGVNSGAWVDDSWWTGGNSGTSTAINTGLLKTTPATGFWGAQVPLLGSPADAYIEANLRTSILDTAGTPSIGLRRAAGSGVGVFCGFNQVDSTHINCNLAWNGTPSRTGTSTGTFVVANALNYIARMEVQGNAIRVYLNGTLVLSPTLNAAGVGGAAYIDNNGFNTATYSLDYVEAGSLVIPPSPPFWTRYQRCYETDT